MIQPWKKHEQKIEYDCGFFQIQVHQSSSPLTGKKHPFYVLATRSWTNVIAITPEKKILLVSQYRHGTGAMSLETPGGAVDLEEDPMHAAKRELLEETGYEGREWYSLGKVHPNPAMLNNTCYYYLALGAHKVADLKLDEAEELEVGLYDLKEVPSLIQKGEIQHALVIAAFQFLQLFSDQNPGKV